MTSLRDDDFVSLFMYCGNIEGQRPQQNKTISKKEKRLSLNY